VTLHEPSLPLVAIYADESCLGNGREGDNPGGAGVLVEFMRRDGEIARFDLWVAERATTNNRMALRSVTESFRGLSRKQNRVRAVFTSDSKYIIDGMTSWVHGWARRGWTRKGGAIENLALWHEAIEAASEHDVSWRWVRGHNGHAQNEYANDLAVRAAETQTRSEGLIPSDFDTWLTKRPAATRSRLPETFPATGDFRPSSRLPSIAERRP